MAFGKKINQRKLNKKNHIIDLFRKNEMLSKVQAKELSGYSMDTIISVFKIIVDENIIFPVEGKQKLKGRKATFYSLDNNTSLYLGLTFNQAGLYSSIVSFSNKVIKNYNMAFKPGITKEVFLQNLKDHINEILEENSSIKKNIKTIAVAIPGDIDLQTGILNSYVFMPFISKLNFKRIINDIVPDLEVHIYHNIHSMTSYLLHHSEMIEKMERVLFVSARSGAANGMIFKNQIVTGHGELGHVKVVDDNITCVCGRKGCLDNYFSQKEFIKLLSKYSGKDYLDPSNDLNDSTTALNKLTELYNNGNGEIKEEFNRRLLMFTSALLDLINLTVPDMVVLSGELLSIYGDPIKQINKIIDENFKSTGFIPHLAKTKIIYENYGTEIASLGACYDVIRKEWGYSLD